MIVVVYRSPTGTVAMRTVPVLVERIAVALVPRLRDPEIVRAFVETRNISMYVIYSADPEKAMRLARRYAKLLGGER